MEKIFGMGNHTYNFQLYIDSKLLSYMVMEKQFTVNLDRTKLLSGFNYNKTDYISIYFYFLN